MRSIEFFTTVALTSCEVIIVNENYNDACSHRLHDFFSHFLHRLRVSRVKYIQASFKSKTCVTYLKHFLPSAENEQIREKKIAHENVEMIVF